MVINNQGDEYDIYLAPEEEKIENAAEIAATSEGMEKFIFNVFYALSDKEVILSELKRIGALVVNQSDVNSMITVKMSMKQLAAIKTLECVERVEMPDQNQVATISNKQTAETTSMAISAVSDENNVSLLCYDDSSDCDYSNDISTAIYLPLSTTKSGTIHCPCGEMWYRFTASASNASQYSIYTTGSLDTVGYLYDANGSYITQNDDNGGLNFSITRALTYGATYYICVKAYGSNTGDFSIRVNYTTSSSSEDTSSDDCSNDMSTAIILPLSTYVAGSIGCPCAEMWYRFTASNSNATQYTIYTSGSLDTVGYLYDSSGNLLTSNDDAGENLNFSITRALTYGSIYYVCVKAYGSNTGSYNIRVDYTTSSGGSDDSDCSNSMSTAIGLTLNSWQSGEICCPGAEMWYKFTPSSTAYYTVYTVGSLDTVGHIYDANSNQLDSDDDDGTGLNFRIVARLTAGQTYYVKVAAYGSNTGYFSIAVTNTVFVEYVSIDQSSVYLDKGDTVTLTATITPTYATNKTLRWETSDSSVATVSQSGVVTARGAGTACICAYSQDGTDKSSCYEVSVNVPVESVTINTSSLFMRVGEYDYLYAEVCPTDAVNKLIRWTSADTSVVWVNEATGRVEARGIGTATIYATAQDGTGVRGSCAVQVEAPIAVQGIDICCSNYTMNVGESTYLSYDIYPSDATNKDVTWCSSNPSVATVDASTGRVTAMSAGATTITVITYDGNYVASCELTVIIDTVTIQKDGAFNKVVFNSSGKVWRCINHDMIFDENYMYDTTLTARSNHNFFTYYNESDPLLSDTTPKEYTDDEIKLLYSIDPHGVAIYIQRFAAEVDGDLEDIVKYKDRIFRLLFNREPKYFARTIDGVWYRVDTYEEINDVLSESEAYFGMHPIYDWNTFFEILGVCSSILNIVFLTNFFTSTVAGVIISKTVKTGLLIASGMESVLRDEFGSYAAGNVFEKAFEKTSIEWAYNIVSLYESLDDLAEAMNLELNYNKEIIDYCACQTGYEVLFELKNGTIHNVKNVCGMLN